MFVSATALAAADFILSWRQLAIHYISVCWHSPVPYLMDFACGACLQQLLRCLDYHQTAGTLTVSPGRVFQYPSCIVWKATAPSFRSQADPSLIQHKVRAVLQLLGLAAVYCCDHVVHVATSPWMYGYIAYAYNAMVSSLPHSFMASCLS